MRLVVIFRHKCTLKCIHSGPDGLYLVVLGVWGVLVEASNYSREGCWVPYIS